MLNTLTFKTQFILQSIVRTADVTHKNVYLYFSKKNVFIIKLHQL